jgi:hypothetical protein
VIKRLGSGGSFGALAIRFSGPHEKDLAGEYFTADTDFGPRAGSGSPVLINHGRALETGLEPFADLVLPGADVKREDAGIFASVTLDPSDPIQSALAELCEAGAFRWSSGSSPQFVKRGPDGWLSQWLPIEFSMVTKPCEFRLPRLRKV